VDGAVSRRKKEERLRLAVFVDQVFWFDGHCYSTDEAFIKFVLAFDDYFDKITFYGRVATESGAKAYTLDPEKTAVHPLPWYDNVYSLCALGPVIFPRAAIAFTRISGQWDLLWLVMPHPMSLLFAGLCKWMKKPFFMMVRQNIVEQTRHRYRGLPKAMAMATAMLLERFARALAAVHPTFTVGDEMYRLYKRFDNPVFPSAVSLISANDIMTTRKASPIDQVKLLSVGRLDPEKGLVYLVRAVDKLIKEARVEVLLRIVGTGSEENNLKQEVAILGLGRHVQFLGYIPFGPDLLEIYRKSDIFVLPSLNEGLPQVLLEAMACDVPVVATKVAGIPMLISHGENGLLVDPADVNGLTDAVCQLVGDKSFGEKIRKNGLRTAKAHTIEAEVENIVSALKPCFPELNL